MHHALSLSLSRNRVVSTRERRERERATVDDDVNSTLSPLCTTVSASDSIRFEFDIRNSIFFGLFLEYSYSNVPFEYVSEC